MHRLVAIFCLTSSLHRIQGAPKKCGPGTKQSGNDCISLTNNDVLSSFNWLSSPPHASTACKKLTTVQGIAVCEDNLKSDCVIWSTISSNRCDEYGSLEFEKYWSRRCNVVLYHFTMFFKGNICSMPAGKMKDYNIEIIRNDMWGGKCFNCLYPFLKMDPTTKVDVFKIQARGDFVEDFDGVQFTVLSDFYLHLPWLINHVDQITVTASINSITLIDNVGREAENSWNMWATQRFLGSGYAAISSRAEAGPYEIQPQQFSHTLEQARVSPSISYYHHTFQRETDKAVLEKNDAAVLAWKASPPTVPLRGVPPAYCTVPSAEEDEKMQEWIRYEINARCHLTRLHVPCDFSRGYDAIIPCPFELMQHMSEDYAAMKGWCDFKKDSAAIAPLVQVDPRASPAFQKPRYVRGDGVRLAFLFTVYSDAAFVCRLLRLLYSKDHYYLLHIDPAGSTAAFERDLRTAVETEFTGGNIFIAKDIPIVYGASTATILLTRTMAWFATYASGWDYMVPVTGSDYPLMPLHRLERILKTQWPPMPFVMAWTPGTSTHIFRLEKTHPIFETDPTLQRSITAVSDERGKPLGAVPMEYRSSNFGPPLFCAKQKSFYHLDHRRNKTSARFDTMWLFPRDIYPGRGRAYSDYDPTKATPSFDGGWRIWKKSDPATTGMYDRESVEYIVNSDEGRKYFHFFKHMLLGSEEHYYVSLLYNWPRTQSFVQTLSAQSVWNTWELGLWEQAAGFQTHTHFLTTKEFDIIRGFAQRGMAFARKFSQKKTPEILDMIDAYVHHNASTDAGLFWPGYFEVDIWTPGKQWVAAYRRNQTRLQGEQKSREKEKMKRRRERAEKGAAAAAAGGA